MIKSVPGAAWRTTLTTVVVLALGAGLLTGCGPADPAAPATPGAQYAVTADPSAPAPEPPSVPSQPPAGVPIAGVSAEPASVPPLKPLPEVVIADGETSREPLAQLELQPVFPALAFDRMVGMYYPRTNSERLYLVLQEGRIVSIASDPEADSHRVFLDLTDRVSRSGNEEGLLGLAFDPEFARNGYLYVYYSAAGPRRSVISRFRAANDRADPGSELIILEIGQPHSNHNGGEIAFGPDRLLYIGLGDGGSAGDPNGNGQDLGTLLGTILRIDVSSIDEHGGYVVPAGNPFVGQTGPRPEIWAYGLRNPWRFSFDRLTGDLWTADVGQNLYEEIDLILPGANYGWNLMEGAHCFAERDCSGVGLVLPVAEYDRTDGCSVTGGYVYRGSNLPSLYGAYVYGDFCSGRIWALRFDGRAVTEHIQIADTALQISAFAEGPDGELYVISFTRRVYRFVEPDHPG